MYEEDEQSASNIIPAIRRYQWHLMVSIPVLLIIAVIVVLAIPPVYRSTGTVMVETQQIPSNLVQSTVTNAASEQIEIITQRVMTREKLMSIVGTHPYFGFKDADPVEQSNILNDFRKSVSIQVTSANSGRQSVAIGFTVSFDSDSPGVAQAMASDLVNLFLAENVKARTQRASETTEFLKAEAEKMRTQLADTEAEVAEFKRKNKDSLPEHLNLYMGMREDTRRNLSDINESLTALNDQISTLQNQLSLSKQQGTASGADGRNELASLRQEYNRLLLQYQPGYPDLVLLRKKIAMLEGDSIKGEIPDTDTDAQRNIRNQISSLEAKRKYLQDERKTVSDKLADLEQRIIKIPQVERGFAAINRNYQTIQDQYRSLQEKAQSAAMAESLENEQKAERFTLLEAPLLPARTFKPNRKKLLLFALAAAIGLPIALVILAGVLDKSIHSAEHLTTVVGAPPLIEIPYIFTRQESDVAKARMTYGIAGAFASVMVGLILVHTMVMSLDVVVNKVIARIGM